MCCNFYLTPKNCCERITARHWRLRLLQASLWIAIFLLIAPQRSSGQCTNPTINLPDQETPVNGNPSEAYCVSFTFDPATTGLPTSLSMELQHTFQGDLSIFVNACGNTLNIMQRPGEIGNCGGGAPYGNSNEIGSPGNPVLITFSDSGTQDPENGIDENGGLYGITSDDDCGIGSPGINSFAALWAGCPPGNITAEVCIDDHAFVDAGVAQNVTFDFLNASVCGCTDPAASNYDPNADVDDGSCIYAPCTVEVSVPPTLGTCADDSVLLPAIITNQQNPPVSFSWSATNGGMAYVVDPTQQSLTLVFPPGANGAFTYTITVFDGDCVVTNSTTVTVAAPEPPVIPSDYVCSGHPATLEVVNGPFVSYEWSNGMSGSPIQVTQAGVYSVIVTDANGCKSTGSVTVTNQPDPVVNITGDAAVCPNGFANLQATGGYVDYQWSPPGGSNGASYVATAPGLYQVTATDNFGCQASATFNVAPAPGPQPVITGGPLVCQGTTITLDAGPGFNTYQWSNSAQQQVIQISTGGQYSVTVTDANNCVGTASVFIGDAPLPQPVITGDLTVCQGQTTTLTASPGFDSYQWSTNQSGPAITVAAPGPYSVTVTNADGCTGVASVTVAAGDNPQPLVTGEPNICPGESTTLTASPGFQQYVWSDNSTAQSITVTQPGIYDVTVVNSAGCIGTASMEVFLNPEPMPAVTGDTTVCPGEAATLSIVPAFESYAWSDGADTQTRTATEGTLTVTVVNAEGCTGTATVNVQELASPEPVISGDNSICADTTTRLDAGAGYETYLWSNDSTQREILVADPGLYSVTVTDENGCEGIAEYDLTVIDNPSLSLTGDLAFCEGAVATIMASDTTLESYLWSTGATGPILEVDAPGTYVLTATDANGCEGTTEATIAMNTNPVVAIDGLTEICPEDSTLLDAGPGFSSYLWSDGSTAPALTVSAPGLYSVAVADANGCVGADTVNVANFPAPTPVIDGPTVFCEATGAALDAGEGYADYRWSTGETEQVITVTASGEYLVTVTDANGCSAEAALAVSAEPELMPVISGPAAICPEASATLDAGPGYATYLWSDGSQEQTYTANAGGLYEVTVTDQLGCQGTASFSVSVLAPAPVAIAGALSFCENDSTTLIADPGFSTYTWSDGSSGSELVVDVPGAYSVTATDADGCSVSDTVSVLLDTLPEPAVSGILSFCTGENTVLDAGPGFAAYDWSNGADLQTATIDQPGTYSVTVTNDAGCTAADTVQVAEVPELSPVISGETAFCAGASALLDAGAGYATYLWSDGTSAQTLSVADPGVYGLTVTDANGCAGDTTVTIAENALPVPAISGVPAFCAGDSTVLSAGPGLAGYLWSDGTTAPDLVVDNPGTYGLTVTDANGCSDSTSIAVVENQIAPPVISGATAFCAGDSTLLAGGAGYVNYSWSDGSAGQFLTVADGGVYELTVTDNNGCSAQATVDITEYPVAPPQIAGTAAFCAGDSTALDAGPAYQSYTWSDGSEDQTLWVDVGGAYAVTVTDANGCIASASVQVLENDLPSVIISGSTSFCVGGATTLNAGDGFAAYLWSDGSQDQELVVDAPGNYEVTVVDDNGCENSNSVSVTEDVELNPVVTGATAFCAGDTVALDAGAGYATYLWSDNSAGQTLAVSTPGDYGVTVTDATGCIGDTVVTVQQYALPQPALAGPDRFCAGESATLDAGPGYAGYSWSTGDSEQVLSVDDPGFYQVTVTDANGCSNTAQLDLAELPLPQPEITGSLAFCSGDSTILSAGGSFAAYQWTGGATGNTLTVNSAGVYGLTVTDVNGCSNTNQVTVNENALPESEISGVLAFCAGEQTTLDGGPGYAAYQWTDGGTQQTLQVDAPGFYEVTVTNALGCESTSAVTVVEWSLPEPEITGEAAFCTGSSSLLTTSQMYEDYLWSTSDSGPSLVVNAPGAYEVTVTDANGCRNNAQLTVTENPLPEPSITGALEYCAGQSTTLAVEDLFAGYQWTGGSQDAFLTVDAPGQYAVTVTDANGCENTAQATVSENPLPQPEITGAPAYCAGENTTLAVSDQFPAIEWTNGENTPAITVSDPGEYGVIVTDANGCENTDQVIVTENPLPEFAITGAPQFCAGESNVLSVADGFAEYQWSSGNETAAFEVTEPGTYAVTVTDNNGCAGQAELTVAELPLPEVTIEGEDYLCTGAAATLFASGDYAQYLWSNGTEGPENTVMQPGLYSVTVASATGCIATESINITEISLPVADAGAAQDLTCVVNSITLGGTGTSQGDYQYQWSGPGIDSTNAGVSNPVVTLPGDYLFTVIDPEYGCVSLPATVSVADLSYEPLATLEPDNILDCETSTVKLNGEGSQVGPGIVYRWYDANGALLDGVSGLSYETSTPAVFTLQVIDTLTGCMAEASAAVLQDIEYPVAAAGEPAHLTCAVNSAGLDGAGSSPGMNYSWTTNTGSIISGAGTLNPVVNAPGIYILSVANPENGCVSRDTVMVTQDADLPLAEAGDDQFLDCHTEELTLSGAGSSAGPQYEYEWTLLEEGALVGTALNIQITEPGIYQLQVLNLQNGCSQTDQVVIAEIGNFPENMEVVAEPTTCYWDRDGGIRVEEVTGGELPLLYSLNGSPFGSTPDFTGLAPGEYEVMVQDAAGCELSTRVVVPAGNIVNLNVGPDETILMGDTVSIEANTNLLPAQIASFRWTAPDSIACPGCFEQMVAPMETTDYVATIIDQNGCEVTDQLTIFVENPYEVYVPNAFSPNGDGNNDVFMIYSGPNVEEIESFQVFNRWGEIVFEVAGVPTNDENYGWNGVYRQSLYNAGVFAWFAKIKFLDGATRLFEGDVLLVR